MPLEQCNFLIYMFLKILLFYTNAVGPYPETNCGAHIPVHSDGSHGLTVYKHGNTIQVSKQ